MNKLLTVPHVLVGSNSIVPLTCRIISSVLHSSNYNDTSIIREGLIVLSKALPKFSVVIAQVKIIIIIIIICLFVL